MHLISVEFFHKFRMQGLFTAWGIEHESTRLLIVWEGSPCLRDSGSTKYFRSTCDPGVYYIIYREGYPPDVLASLSVAWRSLSHSLDMFLDFEETGAQRGRVGCPVMAGQVRLVHLLTFFVCRGEGAISLCPCSRPSREERTRRALESTESRACPMKLLNVSGLSGRMTMIYCLTKLTKHRRLSLSYLGLKFPHHPYLQGAKSHLSLGR